MGVTKSKLSLTEGSYIRTPRPSKRTPDLKTIPDCLAHHARTRPNKEAVVFVSPTGGERIAITYKEVFTKSRSVARNLLLLGVKRNEVIAISLRPCPEWLFVTFGAMMAGIIPCPVVFALKDGSDIVEVFRKLQSCSCMVMEEGYQGENWSIFKNAIDSISVDGKVKSDTFPTLRYLIGYHDNIQGAKPLDELLNDSCDITELPAIAEDDIAIFLQSSGSTGVPKIISHTHASLMTFTDYVFGPAFSVDGIHFNDRPLGWIGGFPFSLLIGQTRVTRFGMCPPTTGVVGYVIDTIRKERCHSFLAMPSIIQDLLKQKNDFGENWPLKTVMTGGQPMSKQSLSSIGHLCQYIIVIYGGTEFSWISANVLEDADKFTKYNCGQLLANKEVKVVDSDGIMVSIGETGEIYHRGPHVFKGYWNDPKRNAGIFSKDGWYKTDDVGRILPDGSLIVEGRISNIINVDGLNVSPEICEHMLQACPGVEAVVILPVPDEIKYQQICACVKVAPGSDVTEDAVRQFCEDSLADKQRNFSVLPAYYLILDSFPILSTGKVSRKALEAMAKNKFSKKCSDAK